jgi:hypothetical protein
VSRGWIPNLKWPVVAAAVAAQIERGDLEPGAVASIAGVAPEFGVSRKTAAQ